MIKMRSNKEIVKFLEGSKKLWKTDIKSLNLTQIEWRSENTTSTVGLRIKVGFNKYMNIPLLKKTSGDYVLLSPNSRSTAKEELYLYDVLDIDEFVKRYPVKVLSSEEEEADLYPLFDNVKDHITRGFIETRQNEKTYVFEIA